MRGAVADGVVAPTGDAPTLGAPRQELFADVAELCTQIARGTSRAARSAWTALAVLMEMVRHGEEHALGVGYIEAVTGLRAGGVHGCSRRLSAART